MQQYRMREWVFKGKEPEKSKVNVNLQAVFWCEEEEIHVKGFYAGNGEYKVRFYPSKAGTYHWKVEGIVNEEGTEICQPAEKNMQGMVKVDGLHFRYESGEKYLPFGTTVYAMLHQKESLIEETMKTLKESPFNKLRFCVFPKYFPYNVDEPEMFPFEKREDGTFDVNHPCFLFWNRMEERIVQLAQMGMEADLILFHPYDKWGFAELTKEECLIYLDYVVRRLSAYPNIWWSLANEYDVIQKFPYSWWTEFAAFIGKNDVYGHLLSNHNNMAFWDFYNVDTTHCSLQDSNVQCVPDYQKKYGKPVVIDECCYEGNLPYGWGNLSAFEMVNRFWITTVCGGYCTHGETFLDPEDIIWWSKGGKLHGKSVTRIGFLKELLESFSEPIDFLEYPNQIESFSKLKEHPEALSDIPGFAKGLVMQPIEKLISAIDGERKYQGHCGEDVYLYYLGRQCSGCICMELPEDKTYTIEMIDVWEMTRTEVTNGVSGKVEILLPGKEGIAVLARRV